MSWRQNPFILIVCILVLTACQENNNRQAGICLSFDDRTIEEWHSMRSVLNDYNAKVTFFISEFDSLSEAEIGLLDQLAAEGHEIGSHGALHVNAEYYIKEHSYDEYIADEIEPSIASMTQHGYHPRSFAYPYGAKYWFTDYLLKKKFSMLRGVSGFAYESDIAELDEIYYTFNNSRTVSAIGIDRGSGLTEEQIDRGITRALERQEVILFYGHTPSTAEQSTNYQFDMGTLRYILEKAVEKKLKFYRISDLRDQD
jgi:peptidoglycan-N-acetylglucosamine deacetylase